MFKLPIRVWNSDAGAVFSGQYGSATQLAQESQRSRETVDQREEYLTPTSS
jgi:hypothetical protein